MAHLQENMSVLVVEDELLVRLDAVYMFETAGYKVYEAGNAEEAIRLIEQHADIRLVFTDVNMPGAMNGIGLAHFVRGRWPPIHLIVTSGRVSVNQQEVPHGTTFIGKPYSADLVTRMVSEMVEAARLTPAINIP